MPDKPTRVPPVLDDDSHFQPLPPRARDRLVEPDLPVQTDDEGLRAPRPADPAVHAAQDAEPEQVSAPQRVSPPPTRAIYKVKRTLPAPLRWLAWTALAVVLVSVALVAPWMFIDPPTSSFMVQDALRNDRPVTQTWVDWEAIADTAPAAVIAAEGQRFYQHFGFDVESMRKAWEAHQRGEDLRGASTITQQTVKNLLLSPHRSLLRKGVEAWLTAVAEVVWTKQRTLTLYLNLAQFGDGLYGVEAASQHYFGKPAAKLSRSEAAWLAVLLPAPTRYRINPPTEYTRQQHAWILSQMAPTVGR